MAHKGWLSFAGVEILNEVRARTYTANSLPTLHVASESQSCSCRDLPTALLDGPEYTDPVTDGAPWIDADNPHTARFYGVWPLSVKGLTDSTRSASIVESISDGGSVLGVRETTREIRVTALMVAHDDVSMHYGEVWLKDALRGNGCSGCTGDDLCFMIGCPTLPVGVLSDSEIDESVVPLLRQLRKVTCIEGPTVTREYKPSCAGQMQVVEFILVAGVPFVYGIERLVMLADGLTVEAAAPGATIEDIATLADCPSPVGERHSNWANSAVVSDPRCPALPPPPARSPSVLRCVPDPDGYTSRAVYIPADIVPASASAVPMVEMVVSRATRGIRVRFIPQLRDDQEPIDLDPCSACGEFVIDYMPEGSTFILDGLEESIYVEHESGQRSPASHLVFGIDGEQFSWPELTCGVAYYALIDIPTGSTLKTLRLSVAIKE